MKLEMKYFVLKPGGITATAEASREAMKTYARIIREVDQQFSDDIMVWVATEEFIAEDIKRSLQQIRKAGEKDE